MMHDFQEVPRHDRIVIWALRATCLEVASSGPHALSTRLPFHKLHTTPTHTRPSPKEAPSKA